MLLGCVGSFAFTQASWATVEIRVTALASVNGLNSSVYNGASVLNSSGWAGGWDATIMSGPQAGFNFLSFCTDIGNTMGNGTWTYEPTTFSSASDPGNNNGIPPDPSWANGGTSGQRASLIYNNNKLLAETAGTISINSVSTTQLQRRSALAIAIWEALYEDASTGLFSVSTKNVGGRGYQVTASGTDANNARDTANFWLMALNGANAGSLGPNVTWFAEQEPGSPGPIAPGDVQSLMAPASAVPEPATYLAGALLALPFLASTVRTRFQRKA